MQYLNRNILVVGRILVLVFFLASSGFTVIVYNCTMTQDMPGMNCCAASSDCGGGTCPGMDGPQTPPNNAITVGQPCQTETILGGYQVDPTVVAKEFNGWQVMKIDLLSASVHETVIGNRVDVPAFHLASAASNVSAPSVETYVLNASFLI